MVWYSGFVKPISDFFSNSSALPQIRMASSFTGREATIATLFRVANFALSISAYAAKWNDAKGSNASRVSRSISRLSVTWFESNLAQSTHPRAEMIRRSLKGDLYAILNAWTRLSRTVRNSKAAMWQSWSGRNAQATWEDLASRLESIASEIKFELLLTPAATGPFVRRSDDIRDSYSGVYCPQTFACVCEISAALSVLADEEASATPPKATHAVEIDSPGLTSSSLASLQNHCFNARHVASRRLRCLAAMVRSHLALEFAFTLRAVRATVSLLRAEADIFMPLASSARDKATTTQRQHTKTSPPDASADPPAATPIGTPSTRRVVSKGAEAGPEPGHKTQKNKPLFSLSTRASEHVLWLIGAEKDSQRRRERHGSRRRQRGGGSGSGGVSVEIFDERTSLSRHVTTQTEILERSQAIIQAYRAATGGEAANIPRMLSGFVASVISVEATAGEMAARMAGADASAHDDAIPPGVLVARALGRPRYRIMSLSTLFQRNATLSFFEPRRDMQLATSLCELLTMTVPSDSTHSASTRSDSRVPRTPSVWIRVVSAGGSFSYGWLCASTGLIESGPPSLHSSNGAAQSSSADESDADSLDGSSKFDISLYYDAKTSLFCIAKALLHGFVTRSDTPTSHKPHSSTQKALIFDQKKSAHNGETAAHETDASVVKSTPSHTRTPDAAWFAFDYYRPAAGGGLLIRPSRRTDDGRKQGLAVTRIGKDIGKSPTYRLVPCATGTVPTVAFQVFRARSHHRGPSSSPAASTHSW